MQTLFLLRRLHLPPTESAVQSCQFNLQFSSGAQQLILQAQLMLTNPHDSFRGQSRSPNMVPFEVLCMLSCLCTIITLSLGDIRYFLDIRRVNYTVTLKPGLGVTQGYRDRHISIRHL